MSHKVNNLQFKRTKNTYSNKPLKRASCLALVLNLFIFTFLSKVT